MHLDKPSLHSRCCRHDTVRYSIFCICSRNCSIGFACYPFTLSHPRLMSWSQVVELADVGLYISKHSGRDAWTAVHATAAAQPADLFARLVHQLGQCVERGEARIVTSLGERTIITP